MADVLALLTEAREHAGWGPTARAIPWLMERYDDRVGKALLTLVDSVDAAVAFRAIEGLAERDHPGLVEALSDIEGPDRLRLRVVRILERLGGERAETLLLARLGADDCVDAERTEVLSALEAVGADETLKVLRQLVANEDDFLDDVDRIRAVAAAIEHRLTHEAGRLSMADTTSAAGAVSLAEAGHLSEVSEESD